jgi:hypothetical protein
MEGSENTNWEENVILIDADYADQMVFELSVQLERMLERRMQKINIAKWVDYVALDGGLRPGNNRIQVLLIYSGEKTILQNFEPSDLKDMLNGHAFTDHLGEFCFASFPVEQEIVTRGKLYTQSAEMLLSSEKVKRLILVPDMNEYGIDLKRVLSDIGKTETTLLTVNPLAGMHCGQEVLTYSLMAALGVKGSELG